MATKVLSGKTLCSALDFKTKLWKSMRVNVRLVTGWKRRIKQQDEVQKVTFQYAGKNTKRKERLYTWGYAATGALGVRTFLRPKTGFSPRRICNIPFRFKFFEENQLQVKSLSCGYGYTVYACVTPDHESLLFGTGINTDSQIGFHESPPKSGRILDYLIEPAPIQLPVKETIKHVACGRAHTIVVTEKDTVMSLGNNSAGQCGRNIVEDEIFSKSQAINKLAFKQQIKQVVCGQDHTMFLTDTGKVYSCGLAADGQTGLGHFDASGDICLVKGDIENEVITMLSCKADCVLAVSDKGDLFGWGNSEYNQLSSVVPDATQVNIPRHLPFRNVGRITKAATGGSMCAFVNEYGQVYVWGYGLLGKGPNLENSSMPSKIPEAIFGKNQFNTDSTVVNIDCGMNFFAALTNKGDLYTWGRNKSGVLGHASDLDYFFPFRVSVPAEVTKIYCGVDHMVIKSKTFA